MLEAAAHRCRARWLAEYTAPIAEPDIDITTLSFRKYAANRGSNSPPRVLVKAGPDTLARLFTDERVLTLVSPALEPHREVLAQALADAGYGVRPPIGAAPLPSLLATVSWVGAWQCFAVNVGEEGCESNGWVETRLTIAALLAAGELLCVAPELVDPASEVLARHGLVVAVVVDKPASRRGAAIAERIHYDLDGHLLNRYDPPTARAYWRAKRADSEEQDEQDEQY